LGAGAFGNEAFTPKGKAQHTRIDERERTSAQRASREEGERKKKDCV
jgi:hypothetical protein